MLEETSTVFLETETGRALGHVQEALGHLETDPSRLSADLRAAESTLGHLLEYYLPLLQAREKAYNAYRNFFMEDPDGVAEELAGIEDILTAMAEKAEGQPLLEIESLAETLAISHMAAAAGSRQQREALERLARRLNQAALKGDLVLGR